MVDTSMISYSLAAVGAIAGILLGFLMGRRGRGDLEAKAKQLDRELSRSEAQSRDQNRKASRMHEEQSSVANFVLQLPYIVQELNREDLDPREVPKLIVRMAQAFFAPDQILLYLKNEPVSGKPLHLAITYGLPEVPNGVGQVVEGVGRIGWVAQHQVEMTREDWHNRSLFEGPTPPEAHPALKLEIMGPLVQHGRNGNKTLGVLCLGRPSTRTRDIKLMLQMVTNLAAIALTHSRNLGKMRNQAEHDGLTGLLNKRKFMVDLGKLIFSSEQSAKSIGLFIFDIDHFKQYNDTNGHPAGDELLRNLGKLILGSLRPGDMACRYGGEEFVVAMPETNSAEALHAAERLRATIERYKFAHEQSQPGGRLTISGGVASFPVDGTSGTELLSHADQALYRAKAQGRNRVVRYEGVEIGSSGGEASFDMVDPENERRRNAAGGR